MERWFKEIIEKNTNTQFLVTIGEDAEGHYVMVEFIFNNFYYTSRYNAVDKGDKDGYFEEIGEQECFNLIISVQAGNFEN